MNSTLERIARLSPQKLALLKKVLGESEGIVEPVAVVGLGCRFAGAANVDEYWQLIRDSVDMTGEIPTSRWNVDDFFDPSGKIPGKMTTRWGGFLEDIDRFDAAFFGISPREAEKMDPQHRLLLEVVWEALEYGGVAPASLRGSSTGVFVGIGGVDYSRIPLQLDNYYEQITAYSGTGNALSIAANRISYTLDLRGPSIAIDTACSSSLVATHLAIRSLRAKECDSAIVGGVNAILTPETTLAFSQAQMLSPDGKCRPFDEQANGYVRGEGCGVLVLKRLSDAVSNGDMVLAIIQGSAVNQDGMTSGITAPRGESQIEVIRQALRDANREPAQVSYIEAHGTATPLGDPIELNSLAQIFGKDQLGESGPCHVGSVKANIGHTETVAGMASLIKTVLMLRHRIIPKQTHFQRLNRHIDLNNSRLVVARETVPWRTDAETVIAGVSGYGFGGTNAHVVLESAATIAVPSDSPERPSHILTLSAKTPERLCELAARFQRAVDAAESFSVPDACYTSAVGRSHFNFRAAIPAADLDELKRCLETLASGKESSKIRRGKARTDRRTGVAFLFAGQGAQYPGMGRALFETHPIVRETLEHCDEVLADQLPQRLLHVLFEDRSENPLIHETLYTQPTLFALEVALSRLWRSFGIEPAVMIGHSLGDYAAACEAGVFSLEEGLLLVAHRARLVNSLPRDGKMAAVFADRELVAKAVSPHSRDVSIAAHNGPQNVVIAGRSEAVDEVLARFESSGVKYRPLEVSHAMHSPLLEPILDEFEQILQGMSLHEPRIPLVSSRDGRLLDRRILSPAYWRDHLRNTVCFVDAVKTLQSTPLDAAIEIGPGTTLCGMASRLWDGEPIAWLPSLRHHQPDWGVLTESLSELYVRGANVDWSSFDRPWKRTRQVLPTYPFESQRFWYDMSRRMAHHVSPLATLSRASHPLVGSELPVAGDKLVFELTLDAAHPAFLADHRIDQSPVVPAAAYMEQALALAQKLFGDGVHTVRNLSIQQALVLPDQQRRVVQLQVGPEQRGERTLEVYSRPASQEEGAAGVWTLHASATLRKGTDEAEPTDNIDRSVIESRMTDGIEGDRFYQCIAECGLQYGPSFQVIGDMQTGSEECLARLELPKHLKPELDSYVMHPAVLDGLLQSIAGVLVSPDAGLDDTEEAPDLILPTHAEQVSVYRPLSAGTLWAHTRLARSQSETDSFEADIDLFDREGNRLAKISSARVQRVSKQRQAGTRTFQDWLYQLRWHEQTLATTSDGRPPAKGHWILIADSEGLASAVADELVARGDDVLLARKGETFQLVASDVQEDADGKADADGKGALRVVEFHPLERDYYDRLFASMDVQPACTVSVVDFRGIASDASLSPGELAEQYCGQAMRLFQSLASARNLSVAQTVLVTRGANAISENDPVSPAQTALWGMGRTAMVEMPQMSCRLIDIDPGAEASSSIAAVLGDLVPVAHQKPGSDLEDHIAYRSDGRFVARLEKIPELVSSPTGNARKTLPASGRYSLRVGATHSFDQLHYEPIKQRPLEPHEVEIQVKSTGLNFSDVLKALGLYPGIKDEIVPLGIECAGVVTRVGASVDRFQPGQRVMGVAPYSFGSHTVTAEYALVPTPENLSDDEAATIPITFLTAYHALCGLARLEKGEAILIHAGAGGVGLAAIQIAQAIGAEIFATAGSESKREFLRSLGVPHVMDSRSLEFAEEILTITSGRGVDVVLNSLPGEAITKSLSVLAAYGRFLEIGKTDIYQNRRIGLWPFQDNLSYFAIDLDRMLRQRPEQIRQLYEELLPHFEQQTYGPLPLTSFPADSVVDAFRYMAQRKNIGKVVVSFAERQDNAAVDDPLASPAVQPGTVLITGGLGALGQQVVNWAITNGAKHVAILTRRDPGTLGEEIHKLESAGVSLAVIQGDVGDLQSLRQALKQLPATFPPVRGVIHAAGVLSDGLIQTMNLDQLHRAMAPKSRGAWNLHETLQDPLDFFVMFSSVAGTIGSPGQGNYAAGNAFLDGLAAHRRHLGKPALSIAWGPWAAEGMAASPEIQRQLSDRGMSPLEPEAAIAVLDQAIRSRQASMAVMDVRWDRLLSKLPGRGPSLLCPYRSEVESESGTARRGAGDQLLRKKLEAADPEQRLSELKQIIADSLADVMGIDATTIEVEQPLATLGLDSLMGMELRSKLQTRLGVEIPIASLFDEPSVLSLARVVAESFEVGDDSSLNVPSTVSDTSSTTDAAAKSNPSRGRATDLVMLGGVETQRIPLFCVHPVGGDLRCYQDYARAVRSRAVYGLRARGIQGGSHPHESMESMIEDYIASIRQRQPSGPYGLMGWSTGGIFAYEMARRLQEEGDTVKCLVMVDSPLPDVFQKVDLADDARFLVDLIEFTNYFAGTKMDIRYEDLRKQTEHEAHSDVLQLVIKHGVLPAGTSQSHLSRLIRVCKQHVAILQGYQPTETDLPVYLLRPEDTSMLSRATGQTLDDDLGWGTILPVQTQHVPGHHFTMMTGPNAAIIARRIDDFLLEPAYVDSSSPREL